MSDISPLHGLGLWFRPSPETFQVEESPAYLPIGEGEHTFVWLEKWDLTTQLAAKKLAQVLGVSPSGVGYAGLKDRHAVTRQWFSVLGTDPKAAGQIADERSTASSGMKVLSAARHGNKLRVGHLKGNRFWVRLGGEPSVTQQAITTYLKTALDQMVKAGCPNAYGRQRFGRHGDNVETGIAILRKARVEKDRRRRDLMISAVQSAVFNETLALRREKGLVHTALVGDVLKKSDTGGLFAVEDAADAVREAQARLDSGAVVTTGPLPGNREKQPPPDSAAGALEAKAMERVGVRNEDFAALGRKLPGARRPLVLSVSDVAVDGCAGVETPDGPLLAELTFHLPPGAYATVVLENLGIELRAAGAGWAHDRSL